MTPTEVSFRRRLTVGLVAGLALVVMAGSSFAQASANEKASALDRSKLPLSFVKNAGQAAEPVAFQVNTLGGTMSFVNGEVVIDLPVTMGEVHDPVSAASAEVQSAMVRVHYVGARADGRITSQKRLPGVVNYLLGDDSSRWLREIPTFGEIVYEGLYQGIDLHYDGTEGRLKGTFHLGAGVDPSQISWRYDGACAPELDALGNLQMKVVVGDGSFVGQISELAPIAWQTIGGVKVDVPVKFVVKKDGSVGFDVGTYDKTQPLVLDPILVYSTLIGGNGTDHVVGLKIDDQGFIYITGRTHSNAANPGPGYPTVNPIQGYGGEIADAYVSKFDNTGQFLVYSTYLGGGDPVNFFIIGGADWGIDLDIDSSGRAHVCGFTESSNFPTTPNAYSTTKSGGLTDAFYSIISANGSTLEYSTYLGGSGEDYAWGVKVLPNGGAVIGGYTGSGDFPTDPTAFQPNMGGFLDAFMVRFTPAGMVDYSTYFGFDGFELGYDIDVDPSGDVYLAGRITSTIDATLLNPIGVAPLQPMNGGQSDCFLVKFQLNHAGLADLRYFTYWGGFSEDYTFGLEVDSNFDVYMTGITGSPDFPTLFTQLSFGGEADIFAMKTRTTGSGLSDLKYSVTLGGIFFDQGFDIAVNNGFAYVGGLFTTYGSVDCAWVKLHNQFGFVMDFDLFGTPQFFDMILGIDVNQFNVLSCGGYTACANGTTANLGCPTLFPLFNAFQPGYAGGSGDGFVRTYFVP